MISLVIVLIVVGVLLFAVNNWIPIDPKIAKIINVVVVVGAIFYALYAFGVFPLKDVAIPQVK